MSVFNPWTFRLNQTKPLFLFLCNIPLDHYNNLQAVSYSIILYFSLLHHFSLKHLSPINIMNIFINLLYLFSAFSHIKHKLHREYSPVPRIVPSTCQVLNKCLLNNQKDQSINHKWSTRDCNILCPFYFPKLISCHSLFFFSIVTHVFTLPGHSSCGWIFFDPTGLDLEIITSEKSLYFLS